MIDEAALAAASAASKCPKGAVLTFRCQHTRPALFGPSRTLSGEDCRDCLRRKGRFRDPEDTVTWRDWQSVKLDAFPGQRNRRP